MNSTRRDFLTVGALGAMGLGLDGLSLANWLLAQDLAAKGHPQANLKNGPPSPEPHAKATEPRAKACILIWLDGGPSHLETFDPKPDAPAEVRGPIAAISSCVPGVAVSSMMPRLAERLDQVTLVRSVTSPLGEHNFGTHYLLTGFRPTPAISYPSVGSVVTHLRGTDPQAPLPPNIAIPNHRVGGSDFSPHGFLADRVSPFQVGGDPANANFAVDGLTPFPGITDARLEQRRRYLKQQDQFRAEVDAVVPRLPSEAHQSAFDRAYRLMTSESARAAFDLQLESEKTRHRFGAKTFGQSCLLARRLVERGVPFVTVNHSGWDTHNDLTTRLKDGFTGARVPVGLVPTLDQGLAALLDDLAERGLLETTLVMVMGEFGRTPKLNVAGGRDHWPRVFSALFAGAGIPGGQVIGSSDAMAETPADQPVTPADLACSAFHLLGISAETKLSTVDGRPIPVYPPGKPVPQLI